jgi:hypothetical protein
MYNNSLQIQNLKKKQGKLLDFLKKDKFNGDEIRQWIGQTVVYFTEVGVPETITSHFLISLDFRDESTLGQPNNVSHGPFEYHLLSGYKLKKYKLTSVLTAFEVSKNLIERITEQDRIIPKVLVSQLEKYTGTKSMAISLESIQKGYEIKDNVSMLTGIVTSTDSLFNLIPELSSCKNLMSKIKKAYEEKNIQEKYLMSRDILWSINNARIIRNYNIHEPNQNNETTIYESISYVHLLCLLINSILCSGNLQLFEEF